MHTGFDLLVSKQNLYDTAVEESAVTDDTSPGRGEAILRIDRFGFSANNVTYAVFGETMGYWNFFPAREGWGRVPVWGFADVVASNAEGIAEGARYFGFLPPSTHLVVRPVRIDSGNFVDGREHRSALPSVYNRYVACDGDPSYERSTEDLIMLLRPLFMTAFLLDAYLADEVWFGADAVVATSASSKTAFSFAHLLHQRNEPRPALVGLTSSANFAFVESLGCYDRVLAYDEIEALPRSSTAIVDFAGDASVIERLHSILGDNVTYDGVVGKTHWDAEAADAGSAAPQQFFFAPDHVEQRTRDWGPGELDARYSAAWRPFTERASGWLNIVRGEGPESVRRVYEETIRGSASPEVGHSLTMWGID